MINTIMGIDETEMKAIWERLYSKKEYEKLCRIWGVNP